MRELGRRMTHRDVISGVRDVIRRPAELDGAMQSFFLAETLKYIYLLFTPPEFIHLQDYVFNTEVGRGRGREEEEQGEEGEGKREGKREGEREEGEEEERKRKRKRKREQKRSLC